jgi:hypothetical protein
MLNRQLLLTALSKVPDAKSTMRFVDNMNKLKTFTDERVQTDMAEQLHAQILIEKDTLRQDGWVRWTLLGDVTNAPPSAIDYIFRLRWGGMLGTEWVIGDRTAPATGVTNSPWRIVIEIQSGGLIGVSCRMDAFMTVFWMADMSAAIFYGTANFDTTVETKLIFTVEADSIAGAPVFRTLGGLVETF